MTTDEPLSKIYALRRELTEAQARIQELEGLVASIAQLKCYCSIPSIISCNPCKAKAIMEKTP